MTSMTHASEDWRASRVPPEFIDKDAPEIEAENVEACPVCAGTDAAPLAVGFDYEIRTCCNPWRFVRCQKCEHVWLNPRPTVSDLSVIYPQEYYAYNYETEINALAVKGKQWLDELKMGSILSTLARAPSNYMDVGCGTGRFLKLMHAQGIAKTDCYGLDIDRKATDRLREQGFSVTCGRVEEADPVAAGTLDLVTMFHVIEHVADPGAVIAQVGRWLAVGGVFAIETPNIDSLDARLFKRSYWGGYHIPRHWNLFSPESLRRHCEDNGFEVVATRYQTGHSFWMYSLHHALRYGKRPMPRLAQWFNPFKSLPFLIAFTAFDMLRATLGFRTSAMLVIARKI